MSDFVQTGIRRFASIGYYSATLPYRWWLRSGLAAAGRAPILVLFYHRIADDRGSPWTHSNDLFRRQIRWLQRHCELISLAEAQGRIRERRNSRLAACITFDDGYAENCERAIPLLVKERIPCTYFVSSGQVLRGLRFAHDELAGYAGRPNTLEQLRWMVQNGVEIGAHTRTHADLGAIRNESELRDELLGARDELQDVLDTDIRYFSFPFGLPRNLNARAFELAYEHGYAGVCSAYGDYNFSGDDPFHIRRIHVDDMLRLRSWATVDPRKLRPSYTFEYRRGKAATCGEAQTV